MSSVAYDLVRPFLWAGTLFCLYGWLLRRLAAIAYPFRMELARLGEETLASDLFDGDRQSVRLMLDNAFSPLSAIVATLVTPFMAAAVALSLLIGRRRSEGPSNPFMDKLPRLLKLFFISAFAANPLFGLIVGLELLVCVVPGVLLLGQAMLVEACNSLVRAEVRAMTVIAGAASPGRSI